MGAYSKFIGSIVGSIVGALLLWAASKGFGTCDAAGVCTVFGINSETITGAVLAVFAALGVYVAPANKT